MNSDDIPPDPFVKDYFHRHMVGRLLPDNDLYYWKGEGAWKGALPTVQLQHNVLIYIEWAIFAMPTV
jgi:hypothetical protein